MRKRRSSSTYRTYGSQRGEYSGRSTCLDGKPLNWGANAYFRAQAAEAETDKETS